MIDAVLGSSVLRSMMSDCTVDSLNKLRKRLDDLVKAPKWRFGDHKTAEKFRRQMQQRGWTDVQIDEAFAGGAKFPAPNNVNPGNPATRYVHPETGRSVVMDDVTGEVLHVGGDGFKY